MQVMEAPKAEFNLGTEMNGNWNTSASTSMSWRRVRQ